VSTSRREFLQHGALGGAGLLTFFVGGCEKKLTPADARVQKIPLRTLSDAEGKTLEALGEVLLPGSAAAGLAHYIDHQLSGSVEDSMLMIKYLGVAPPFAPFYQQGLQSVAAAGFGKLAAPEARAFVSKLAAGDVAGWTGPPAAAFYFVVRNDAIDTMYGTQAGFAKLNVPYMAHILPPSRWGE
jgi:hypothetical protein